MPIDLNGNPVEVGDVVNVAFVVKEAWGDDNFCNLILEPVESMPGSGTRQVESFNSRQVVKTPASTPVPASNVGRESLSIFVVIVVMLLWALVAELVVHLVCKP